MSREAPLTDDEIDKLLAARGLSIPDELLPRVRDACRALETLANSLRSGPAK